MHRKELLRRGFLTGLFGMVTALIARASTREKSLLERAAEILQRSVNNNTLRAASLRVRSGDFLFERSFGQASPETVFLIASITKPLTAAGVMLLVDQGKLSLTDPVYKYIPSFVEGDRKLITMRHLLTHTSGLPDQLPENVELRRRLAPLEEFVRRALRTPLLFKPGSEVRYQSMGFLLASEVAERIAGRPFRQFLREELFLPLGMQNTELGLGRLRISETAQSQVEAAPALYGGGTDTTSWNWNSPYWRNLGVPWGGAHSNGPDLEKFLRSFLSPDDSVLSWKNCREMIKNQNIGLNVPWGLGFMVQSDSLGEFCSPSTFGHSGSTGTLCWADPKTETSMVLLTTLPAKVSRESLLEPVSNLVGQAFQ